MSDLTWRKVSEKEKEEIRGRAEGIMKSFSKKLSKIDSKLDEPVVDRAECVREEHSEKCEDLDREIMFGNALKSNDDFIIAEKKSWGNE
jgi:Asp-tRNA(Asn)/Glu-tRNA(Gln) amidotransferase C subunit